MNGFMKNYAQNPGLSAGDYREVMSFFAPEDIPITAFLAKIMLFAITGLHRFRPVLSRIA
jgi:hypothetical protein